jgi:hypothetical protein
MTPSSGGRAKDEPTEMARTRGRLFWGILFVTVGVALLVDPYFDSVHLTVARLWPLIFIVLGIGKLTARGRAGSDGSWLLVLGGWLLLNTLTDWGYGQTWPVLIMFLGARLIWTSVRGSRERSNGPEGVDVD